MNYNNYPGQGTQQSGPYGNQRPQPGTYGGRPPQPPHNEMLEILSMIFGILSLLINCWIGIGTALAVFCGIGAIVCFVVSPKKYGKKTGLAIGGFVTGLIGMLLAFLVGMFLLLGVMSYKAVRDIPDSYDNSEVYDDYYDDGWDDWYDDYYGDDWYDDYYGDDWYDDYYDDDWYDYYADPYDYYHEYLRLELRGTDYEDQICDRAGYGRCTGSL